MTAVDTAPFAVMDLDVERVLAELGGRFPGVPVWVGEFTGHFWALVREGGRDVLVEAETVGGLGRRLDQVEARSGPGGPRFSRTALRSPRPVASGDGSWEVQSGAAGRLTPSHSVSCPAAPSSVRVGQPEVAARRRGVLRRLLSALLVMGVAAWRP